MLHEPFYNSGSMVNQDLGLGLGWVSHPDSLSDGNPIWNERQDVGLVFSGDYFDSRNVQDAFWLVRQYEETGLAFLETLNGIFCGVLIDRRQAKVIVFNDRYGLGRIYYHECAEGFYFSSEAKSLLKILPHMRLIDMESFGEFFSCGCALQDRTLFAGVSLLPGASVWTFAPRQDTTKIRYFNREMWENQPLIPVDEYYQRLEETFTRVLPRYFLGKQRVGLSLTGGLDSRMIIACTDALPKEMPCYTFGGPNRDCADVRIARRLAQACGRKHETIPVSAEFFTEFPELAQRAVYTTDGGLDVTGAVEVFVNRFARQIAPVRMTGNFGSEILRKNVAFKPMPVSSAIFDPSFEPKVKAAETTYASERAGLPTSFIAFKQVPWHHHSRLAVEQSQLLPRSPYLDNDLVALAYQAPADLSLNKSLAHRFIESHNPALVGIPTDRGVVGSQKAKASRLAVFRQEFLPKVEYAMDYGMPQWLAKVDLLMAPLRWERLFLGRQKFYHFRTWYRDELSAFVKSVLLDSSTLERPYLNGREVERVLEAHIGGYGNYTLEIHKLLTSEFIQRGLIEQN